MGKAMGFRQDAEALSPEDAEALTSEIAGILASGYEKVVPLVIRAFRGRAWVGTGFTSWDTYCRERFAGSRMLRIPAEAFTEIALTYADAGMSVRSIASATGASKDTAARAINAARKDRKPAKVIRLSDGAEIDTEGMRRAKAAHPAGKRLPAAAGVPAWQIIVAAVEDAGTDGATCVELADGLGWRESKTTGAISEASRREAITPAGTRAGNVRWVTR